MAITAGEDILASDFINKDERDATPANDENKVAKLQDDAQYSPVFTKVGEQFVAGENITAGEPVFLANNDMFIPNGGTGNASSIDISATTDYWAYNFTTKSITNYIGNIYIPYLINDGDLLGNITVTLEETTAGEPNGTVVATTTIDTNQTTVDRDWETDITDIVCY